MTALYASASHQPDFQRIDPRLELEQLRTRAWQQSIRETIHELQTAADDLAFALQAHFAYGAKA